MFKCTKIEFRIVATMVVLIIAQLGIPAQLHSQVPIGHGEIQRNFCNYYVLHDSITTAPPITTDMPLNCIIGYTVLDSLCKISPSEYPTLLSMIDTMAVENVLKSLKYIYAMKDYDAFKLSNYMSIGANLNPKYVNSPAGIYNLLLRSCIDKIREHDNRDAFLAVSDGIYEVEVSSVFIDSTTRNRAGASTSDHVCMDLKVLDVIKDHAIVRSCVDDNSGGRGFQCIHVYYTLEAPTFREDDDNIQIALESDSTWIDSTGHSQYLNLRLSNSNSLYGSVHDPQVGKRYIIAVYLYSLPFLTNEERIPYILMPLTNYDTMGGMLPIIDGLVYDASNLYGFGATIPVEDFKQQLRSHIVLLTSQN